MLPKNLSFVDIETTGARITSDRIIEIGILRIENNTLVDTYKTLINPQTYLSPFIEELTGITKRELEDAPTFDEVKNNILEILADSVFVAHNVRFDYGFLRNEFRRYDISYTQKHFCTVKLSKYLFPNYKHHNLDSLIERFQFFCKRRHRALDDARVLWDFYSLVQKVHRIEKVEKAVNRALKEPSIPINLPEKTLDSLPDCEGVYIFYAKNNVPLYVGKSVNIHDRVRSHFTSDNLSATEMGIAQQTIDIETIPTSGELGALFLESKLVKELQPLYNRKLRQMRRLIILKKITTQEGYDTVEIEEKNKIDFSEIDQVMGVFKSKKQVREHLVRVAKKYFLCEKILGLQKTHGKCFGYHLGWCKGACENKESLIAYNLRFLEAFSHQKIKPWPFQEALCIVENNTFQNSKEIFVIDKWCYLGSIKSENSQDTVAYEYNFDLDTYKILRAFLFSPKNRKLIQPFSSVFKFHLESNLD